MEVGLPPKLGALLKRQTGWGSYVILNSLMLPFRHKVRDLIVKLSMGQLFLLERILFRLGENLGANKVPLLQQVQYDF